MKTIHLATLDLDLKVPDTIHYHDEGFVESMERKQSSLNERYNHKSALEDKDPSVCGRKSLFYVRGNWHIHIFYLHDKYPENETDTRGHEEMHALRTFDLIANSGESWMNYATQEFQIAALKRKSIGLDIAKIEREIQDVVFREEVIAQIGGIFAVHQKHSCLLTPVNTISEDYHVVAYQIYQKAIQDSLKQVKRINKRSLWQRLLN